MKIFVLRERVDFHNDDPQDYTFLFANGETAARELSRLYDETEKSFIEDEECEIVETGTFRDDTGRYFMTDSDDLYQVWIEELRVNNE